LRTNPMDHLWGFGAYKHLAACCSCAYDPRNSLGSTLGFRHQTCRQHHLLPILRKGPARSVESGLLISRVPLLGPATLQKPNAKREGRIYLQISARPRMFASTSLSRGRHSINHERKVVSATWCQQITSPTSSWQPRIGRAPRSKPSLTLPLASPP
jgi:hypothetical protein